MKSMTGYGRGEASQRGVKVTVEVSSVNRKQSEIGVILPRDLEVLEAQVRDEINQRVARGRLTVRIVTSAADGEGKMLLDMELAREYVKDLRSLAAELKISDAITLDLIARAPGVMQPAGEVVDAEALWPTVSTALKMAMDALVKMREREGEHLANDLKERIARLRQSLAKVETRAPQVVERYREQLLERIKAAGVPVPGLDDERLIKEVFFFADRSDITEEITRLKSHFQQFDDCVAQKEPVGRTFDFLAQEINREVNTIGSKANDTELSREVVAMKAEVEKFREQIQNVE
jgi:uncharacterized protein (TIGR00255 family)